MTKGVEIYYTKTKEDYDQLMDILEYGGYKWIDGSEPTQEHYDSEFPFTVCNDLRNKQLMKFNYYNIIKLYGTEPIITFEKWEGE